MKNELRELKEMQGFLKHSSGEIDEINKDRKDIRTKMTEVENKLVTLVQERKQITQGREFLMDRIVKLESELDDFEQEI